MSANSDVRCPICGNSNPGGTSSCVKCGTPLPAVADLPTFDPTVQEKPSFEDAPTLLAISPPPLVKSGKILSAGRYEILNILGQGGMGAVYKAKDRELDRIVALKVIQPDFANSPTTIKRFKQELILAREVTHKNVIRIFDIGEDDGMKFITMEFVDGVSLKDLILSRGRLRAEEAVEILRQICHALHAAHSAGVIHRDLKPQNIMIDKQGKVVVMDFGIAHSNDFAGMTMTGALVGTPEYMSPEQAKSESVDARSDIFSAGLIFYEMLTGKIPFQAPTAVETIYKRTRERATPPVSHYSLVPLQANKVAMKCLETDPANRYQNAEELLADLETFDAAKKVGSWKRVGFRVRRMSLLWRGVAAAVVGLAVILALVFSNRTPQATQVSLPERQGMQVLVADFTSTAEDLKGTIEPILGLALEGASFIYNVDRVRARNVGKEINPDATAFDEDLARLVAARQGYDVIISGSVQARGNGYRLTAKAVQAATGTKVATAESDASDKSAIPATLTELASSIRRALGDTASDEIKRAQGETISTISLDALQSYGQAQELRSSGRWEEAIRYYTHALQLDPNLGRAYSGIAAAYANLGERGEAQKYYDLALAHIDRMTDREKYRTRGGYYLFTGNTDKAIEEFRDLTRQFPGDTAGQNNLGFALFQSRDFTGALIQGRQFWKMYPNNVVAAENVVLFALYAGDFETTLSEAAKVLSMSPGLVKTHFAKATAELAQNHSDRAIATYGEIKSANPAGASMAAAGLADIALYEGRMLQAVTLLQDGITADLAANLRSAAADKLATLTTIYSALGNYERSTEAADRAVAYGKDDDTVLFRAALAYVESNRRLKTAAVIEQLGSRLQPDSRSYAKILEGEILLKDKKPARAVEKFKEAQAIADSWLGRFDLGRAYLAVAAFAEASSEFDTCLKRRGEATAVFLDDRPTYHLLPRVYYYQARAQEALKNRGAEDLYKAFLSMRSKADKDPLALDAQQRISK